MQRVLGRLAVPFPPLVYGTGETTSLPSRMAYGPPDRPAPPRIVSEDPEALRRQIAQTHGLRGRFQDMAAYGNMTQAELAQRLAGLEDLRASLELRLTAALEAPPSPAEVSPIDAHRALVLRADGAAPSVAKRDMLRLLIHHITPWPDKAGVTIYVAG